MLVPAWPSIVVLVPASKAEPVTETMSLPAPALIVVLVLLAYDSCSNCDVVDPEEISVVGVPPKVAPGPTLIAAGPRLVRLAELMPVAISVAFVFDALVESSTVVELPEVPLRLNWESKVLEGDEGVPIVALKAPPPTSTVEPARLARFWLP